MNDKKLTPVLLREGQTELRCLVDKRVKPGFRVTLKNSDDPDRMWEVLETGEDLLSGEINRGWNNNI